MNLIEESFQNKEEKKRKRVSKIILVAIILIVIIIIAIVAYLMYVQSQVLKLTIDAKANDKLKELLVFEDDGTIYAPIKEIASYFGYTSYNGEYSEKSEIQNKCYVQNENEVANFELGQNKIYKLDLTKGDESNYEYCYIKTPVKAIGGVLYVSSEGLEKAFNISFDYDSENNKITILTMPYLYDYYKNQILDYNYDELDKEFVNQKTLLNDQLVVSKNKECGVIDIKGNVILEPKYDSITYLVNTEDFLVKTNNKVGILSSNGTTKVKIVYDSIELMDSDAGLYVAEKDGRFGVIDIKGNVKIDMQNDEIGYDISDFTRNNIKNKYILAENLIPVRKDEYWALYDKNGKQLTDYKYDTLGYTAASNRDAVNLLVIPNYNVLVVCKDKKYTLLNASGVELFGNVADDIYMTITRETNGEEIRHYYITVNDQIMDAEEYLERTNVKTRQSDDEEKETKSNKKEEQQDEEDQEENNEEQQNDENQEENNEEQQQEENQEENNEEQQDDENQEEYYEE